MIRGRGVVGLQPDERRHGAPSAVVPVSRLEVTSLTSDKELNVYDVWKAFPHYHMQELQAFKMVCVLTATLLVNFEGSLYE